jgi:hypothetical protein
VQRDAAYQPGATAMTSSLQSILRCKWTARPDRRANCGREGDPCNQLTCYATRQFGFCSCRHLEQHTKARQAEVVAAIIAPLVCVLPAMLAHRGLRGRPSATKHRAATRYPTHEAIEALSHMWHLSPTAVAVGRSAEAYHRQGYQTEAWSAPTREA